MLFQKSAPFGVQQSEDNTVHLRQLSLALSNSHFFRIVAIAADAERFLQLLPWRALRVRGPQQGTTVSVAAAVNNPARPKSAKRDFANGTPTAAEGDGPRGSMSSQRRAASATAISTAPSAASVAAVDPSMR